MTDTYPPYGLEGPDDTYPFAVRRRSVAGYGWVPDAPDHRDQLYAPSAQAGPPPAAVDLRARCPAVYNQGKLGSCTGNAIAAAVQYARKAEQLANADLTPSRLFIYFGERVIEDTVKSDPGASLRDGIKVVATDGTCFESGPGAWPYDISKFADAPPAACFEAAKANEVVSYRRLVQDPTSMEACLADGFPFVFGFTAFEDLESTAVARGADLPMPAADDKTIGGHAVMAVGYDRAAQTFLIRNSWGADWGNGGYFRMPYAYLASPKYANDFWTIRVVAGSSGA